MSSSDPVISTQGLVKTFGTVQALDGLVLEVAPGEVHGFLGPNGAGKSTTMRVLLGLLRPDGGRVRLLGGDPWHDAVELHRRLAYVPGAVELWPTMTGGEAIDLLARLRGHVDTAKRDELCDRFDLDPSKKARTYSKGNRQKVALISALACDVDLLLLDEPTAGLDPLMEVVFQQTIAEAKAEGRTVLLSSHILAQVEALADLPGVHDLTREDGRVEFHVDGDRVQPVVQALAGLGVRSLVAHPPTLEQLLMRHYGEEVSADELGTDEEVGAR